MRKTRIDLEAARGRQHAGNGQHLPGTEREPRRHQVLEIHAAHAEIAVHGSERHVGVVDGECAGSIELITCALAIKQGLIPPTINLHDPDPDLDLDYVPNQARPADVNICLSNSFGFGGQNDTIIVKAVGGQ